MPNVVDSGEVSNEVKAMAETLAQKMVEDRCKKMEEDYKKMREEQDKEFQKKMSELIGGSHKTSTSNINKDNDDHHDTDSNKTQFHTYAYNHDKIPKFPSMHFNSLNVGKAPRIDGISYTEWVYRMKMHLVSLHPRLWEIVDVGITLPDTGREMTPKEAQDLYHNAQATSIILSCLNPDEFNKVNGIEIAKKVWDTLKVSYEGDKKVRTGKMELLYGEIERFVYLQGETTQMMFDRLMVLVNNTRALRSQEWGDDKVTRKMLRAYQAKIAF